MDTSILAWFIADRYFVMLDSDLITGLVGDRWRYNHAAMAHEPAMMTHTATIDAVTASGMKHNGTDRNAKYYRRHRRLGEQQQQAQAQEYDLNYHHCRCPTDSYHCHNNYYSTTTTTTTTTTHSECEKTLCAPEILPVKSGSYDDDGMTVTTVQLRPGR